MTHIWSFARGLVLLFLVLAAAVAYVRYTQSPEQRASWEEAEAERGRLSELKRTIAEKPEYGDGYYRGLSVGRMHATLGKAPLSDEEQKALRTAEMKSSGRSGWPIDWMVGFDMGFHDGVEEVRRRRGYGSH